MKTTTKAYLHGDDDSMWGKGERLGITGEALSMFSHAADEFEIELEVETDTGIAKPISFEGVPLAKENELEFLRYFYEVARDCMGPADWETYSNIKEDFKRKKGKQLPEGYE